MTAKRVLIVDDNAESALTIGWMLEIFGHEFRTAKDATTALAEARVFKPDVCMLDIGLPEVSGYELCRMLRAEPGLEHALYIAQTGWDTEDHRRRSREAGFDHHLVKPIDPKLLSGIVAG